MATDDKMLILDCGWTRSIDFSMVFINEMNVIIIIIWIKIKASILSADVCGFLLDFKFFRDNIGLNKFAYEALTSHEMTMKLLLGSWNV